MRTVLLAISCACLGSMAVGQVITEFPIPKAQTMPMGIAAGADGNVWFTEVTYTTVKGPSGPGWFPFSSAVARIGPTGVVTEFNLPAFASGITAGLDGNLWFPETGVVGGYQLGRIDPTGSITDFQLFLSSAMDGRSIAAGPDGSLWATQFGASVVRVTTTGSSTEFPLPYVANTLVHAIALGPDGNMWFTNLGANQIGRITTLGTVTEFQIPTADSQPSGIARGPDGNIWFTEWTGNKIGRITPAGSITEFSIPTPNGVPNDIVAGPDGNLWFTEEVGNKIGRITTAGVISEFPVPTAAAQPFSIAAGPDGNIWFTESSLANLDSSIQKIGKVSLNALCAADDHTLCLDEGRFAVTAYFQQTPSGPSSRATAVPLTNNTGYFWFFDPSNVEMVVKVLTGCPVNGEYWVFAGGLTDVAVEMKVTDTVTGASKSYSNAFGTPFQPIQDSAAFPCP